MAKLLLTSSGFYTESIRNEFNRLLNQEPSKMKAGIITTASIEHKSNNRFAVKAKKDFLSMNFGKVDFIDVEFDGSDCLKNYDVIYINGGNPFYLLHYLKKSGADNKLKELAEKNVIIVGVSAGSMVLGPNINIANFFTPQMNTINLKDLSGLEITDIILFPHYGREDLFLNDLTIEERILKFEKSFDCKVTRLTDSEAVIINNNLKKII
ncbi:Type 1 glutamine amidotransferase-like domain-containing protein [Bacillus alveayuensis]|jgi:dipeptidase E|uniref:Type 1 glutamine amidotransferase-like domain-containing protein n=1 Tax=Aeribacillus alveayuensis TaxID=279215 RepID=UPI0005D0F092|nr:Type 1 glutamine amidotransferase-like domain-containing protein [Bacillus alveayuensis]